MSHQRPRNVRLEHMHIHRLATGRTTALLDFNQMPDDLVRGSGVDHFVAITLGIWLVKAIACAPRTRSVVKYAPGRVKSLWTFTRDSFQKQCVIELGECSKRCVVINTSLGYKTLKSALGNVCSACPDLQSRRQLPHLCRLQDVHNSHSCLYRS